ncbi:Heat shock protein, Hsp20 family [hydrothermal vent metagenome]|uniref:Heat shock protein, Hsp20 family n=1 Tax=hydrothermal vent metagenome TaxID=652676 RepID=A0A3B0YVQ5_9ZZZZ
MSLVRYEPWNLLNQWPGDISRLFDPRTRQLAEDGDPLAASNWTPAADIREEKDSYIIHADVPGVDPEDIEVSMEDGVLSIKGQRQTESVQEQEGYKRVERVRGTFFRRFSMPDTADADAISAKSKHGVLEIVVPKQTKVLPKRIKVKS